MLISKHSQLLRFIVSGGAATAVHYLVMGMLIFFGISAVVATGTGALVGAVLNYVLQYYFTFRSIRRHIHSLISYTAASGLAWLSNLLLFMLFYDYIGINIVFAQLLATALVTIQNYLIYNKLVFHS